MKRFIETQIDDRHVVKVGSEMKKLFIIVALSIAAVSAEAQTKQKLHVECSVDQDNWGGKGLCDMFKAAVAKSPGYALMTESAQGQWTVSISSAGNQISSAASVVLLYEAPVGALFHDHFAVKFSPKDAKSQAEDLWKEIDGIIVSDPTGAVKPAPQAKLP